MISVWSLVYWCVAIVTACSGSTCSSSLGFIRHSYLVWSYKIVYTRLTFMSTCLPKHYVVYCRFLRNNHKATELWQASAFSLSSHNINMCELRMKKQLSMGSLLMERFSWVFFCFCCLQFLLLLHPLSVLFMMMWLKLYRLLKTPGMKWYVVFGKSSHPRT